MASSSVLTPALGPVAFKSMQLSADSGQSESRQSCFAPLSHPRQSGSKLRPTCRHHNALQKSLDNFSGSSNCGNLNTAAGIAKGQRRHRKVCAQVAESDTAKETSFLKLKEFLEDAKSLGSVRIIVNTGLGVLESVTTLEKLFYHAMPGKGMYANLMNNEDNVDFHLLLDKVARVNLVTAKSKRGDFLTYTIRFYDEESFNGASIFVMWKSGTMGEYADGQVEAFQSLLEKWGEEASFT